VSVTTQSSRRGDRPKRARRAAFTLLELLVCLGILAVLLTLMFPAIARVRQTSMDAVCASRLRDLALAANVYLSENNTYPAPLRNTAPSFTLLSLPPLLPGKGEVVPDDVQVRLLNDLAPTMRFPRLAGTLSAADLPPAAQCPEVEATTSSRGPFLSGAQGEFFLTGYTYVGCLGDPGVAGKPSLLSTVTSTLTGVLLGGAGSGGGAGAVAPSRNPPGRAALWADDVFVSAPSGGYWRLAHPERSAPPGPAPLTYAAGASRGQHVARCDGSVDWIAGHPAGGDQGTKSILDLMATYRVAGAYWWF
jgi:prepilin-type N-terminal cleavage/methylation domain-containing protein